MSKIRLYQIPSCLRQAEQKLYLRMLMTVAIRAIKLCTSTKDWKRHGPAGSIWIIKRFVGLSNSTQSLGIDSNGLGKQNASDC